MTASLHDDLARGVSRPLTDAEQDAVVGGMGRGTKFRAGRSLPAQWKPPAAFRIAGVAGAKSGGKCGPFGCPA